MSEKTQSHSWFERKVVRKTLRAWDDLKKMGKHSLVQLAVVRQRHARKKRADTPHELGLSLREVLREAIETLKVNEGRPDYKDKRWRPYIILKEQFVEGRKADYLAAQFDISLRAQQYAQGKAIDVLTSVLQQWEDEAQRKPATPAQETLFMAPPKPAYRLVGRYTFLQTLKEQLFAGGSVAVSAVNGLPGVGKTAVAIEVAHDADVMAHFQDGVLWAGVGREPDILALLGQWAKALHISVVEIAQLTTIQDRANAIHVAIGTRRMLLVMDDVWQLEAALAFRLGGPNCAHLIATRPPTIARDFAESQAITVNELSSAGALLLFGQLAPGIAEKEPDQAQALVEAVGGLPLAIILMAQYARREALARARPLQLVLERLKADS